MKNRFYELDALRGIAALMVVLYHYTSRYNEIYGHATTPLFNFEIGKTGVKLFFIISGFVIFLTINKIDRIKDFFISRFSRLYPTYWAAVLLTYALTTIFTLPYREVDLKTAVINLSMLQAWLKFSNVDGVYWSLAVELTFYAIMSIIFVTKNLARINIIAAIWMLVLISIHYIENNLGIKVSGALKSILIFEYAHLFIAGIMFYQLSSNKNLSLLLYIIIAYAIEIARHPETGIITTFYFIFFYMLICKALTPLRTKPLIFLGSISYSLYLIHQNIGYIIINAIYEYNLANPYSVIFVPLVASILIASLIHYLIEKPAMIHIRNFLH